MNWNKIVRPDGAKLFKVHSFTYAYKGANYHLEVDESADGNFTGHGEHSTDRNTFLASVTGKSLEECLSALIKNIKE
jgi:hypothetical protein